jgi:hypothetical protein
MYGIDAGAGESLSLQRIIDSSQQPGASAKLLIAKTRCALVLGPARYACAGRLSEKARRHFSLNLDCFTQFSSPIRRYLDIVVHRMLLEAVARTDNGVARTGNGTTPIYGTTSGSVPGGGSAQSLITPEFMLQLCEASDKTAARARAVQNLSWDLCLASHLSSTPRVLHALVTQVSPAYMKVYVPQLAYLQDHLRRIPIRVLGASAVNSQDNDTVLVLSWGLKDKSPSTSTAGHESTGVAPGSTSGGSGGCGGGGRGGAAGGIAVGGCWVLGQLTGSASRLDCRDSGSGRKRGEGQTGEGGRGGESDQGMASVKGPRIERHSIRVFDWVRVQLVGHVDGRGIAGPKIEALILGNFAIPFDHRANPQQRLLVSSPPRAGGGGGGRGGGGHGPPGGGGGAGSQGNDDVTSTTVQVGASNAPSDWPPPNPPVNPAYAAAGDAAATLFSGGGGGSGGCEGGGCAALGKPAGMYANTQGGYIMGQLEQMIEGMREVLARHVASAAAALPADATVRFDGVEISAHPLDPELVHTQTHSHIHDTHAHTCVRVCVFVCVCVSVHIICIYIYVCMYV